MNKYLVILIFLGLILSSCKSVMPISGSLSENSPLDYSNMSYWAAHPDKTDNADRIPGMPDNQKGQSKAADVFFIHPTIYTKYKKGVLWNADINDTELNESTDNSTILYQASAFNAAGDVYAPRYRQAHIEAFYTDDRVMGEKALDKAYEDVKAAFQYYLDHYNDGRPIIIASHSQGTRHAKVLLKEFFDEKPLLNRLVAAYIIGISVKKDEFENIPLCENESQTGCFITWRTYKEGFTPEETVVGSDIAVTNPLSWTTDGTYISKEHNKGAILRKFDKVYDQLVDARITNGMLWVNKPKFPFSFLFTRKNYHIADINFFYFNIRENALLRTEKFTGMGQNNVSGHK